MTLSNDEILKQTFLSETSFQLDDVEQFIMELDSPPDRVDCLSKIFRTLHSIKGSAASVGFSEISRFAHIAEDYLCPYRDNPHKVDHEVISLLLEVRDALRKRIDALTEDILNASEGWDKQELEDRLKSFTNSNDTEQKTTIPAFGLFDDNHDFLKAPCEKITANPAQAEQNKHNQKTTIRVDAERVSEVLNLVNQLVVLKGQSSNMPQFKERQHKGLLTDFEKTLKELYQGILNMRMMPLKGLFAKLQRVARDTSVKVSKPIAFHTVGDDVELDRSILDLLGDPLLHLVRNSVDHGIEATSLRVEQGKAPEGEITVEARQQANAVVIEIRDDGAGIDEKRVCRIAIQKKLITEQEAATLSAERIRELIFLPGFSTAAAVTDISGRGVGLDVVKTSIEQMKGHIEVTSELHRGTCFRLTIPTNTALTTGLIVKAGGDRLIIPMDHVTEFMKVKHKAIQNYNDGRQVIVVRDEIVSVYRLSSFVSANSSTDRDEYTALVIHDGKDKSGLIVDEIIGLGQFVLKPLPAYLSSCEALTGAAVMSDGKVAPVVDPMHVTHFLGSAQAS